jgi:N-acetylneuraminate synthase
MGRVIKLGDKLVGDGHPIYVAAEIGINHNGDLKIAKKLIDAAFWAGCDAVKFQKRTPELCVPPEQRSIMRETPWGYISYMEYRERMEFGFEEYREIDKYCRERGISWFVSCWDTESIDFMEEFNPPAYKVPSATATDSSVLRHLRATGRPIIISTGMTSLDKTRKALALLDPERTLLTHCTSTYPCPMNELNLRVIETLRREFDLPIGYSGHEVGLIPSVTAVALGACYIERHITLDRAMWGSDHAASVEPHGFHRLVNYIRGLEQALGDGQKRVYESEKPVMAKLRRVDDL